MEIQMYDVNRNIFQEQQKHLNNEMFRQHDPNARIVDGDFTHTNGDGDDGYERHVLFFQMLNRENKQKLVKDNRGL